MKNGLALTLIFITFISGAQITTSEVNVEQTNNNTFISGNLGIYDPSPTALLEIASGEHGSEAFRLSGQEYYTPDFSSTEGISFILGVNRPGNRQLWIGDSERISKNTNDSFIRLMPGHEIPVIDAVTTDGASPRHLTIQGSSGNLAIGNQVPEAKLQVSSSSHDKEALRLSGQEYYTSDFSSSEGISFVLGVNRPGNRQLWIGDSDRIAKNSTDSFIRLMPGHQTPVIDAITTDGNAARDLTIQSGTGRLGIGTASPTEKLHVNGKIRASAPVWADFVFEPEYELSSIQEVDDFIQENGHLEGIPTEEEVLKNGVDLTLMDAKLLQKIEELTLHLIDQNKKLEASYERIEKLERKLSKLEKRGKTR